MTAPAKTARNGTITAAAPERKTGMAHVHEAEAYHTATIAHDAAFEAERLCNDIYRAVSGAYLRDGGTVSEAAETAATPPPNARPAKPSAAWSRTTAPAEPDRLTRHSLTITCRAGGCPSPGPAPPPVLSRNQEDPHGPRRKHR